MRPQRLAGRYRLDRCLAIGGMAEVWLGTDETLGRQVAIKLLHPNLATDTTFVQRLRREAVAVARINHPGIVAVYDTVSDDGHEAVVMEYVPGQTLRQLLDERGRLEVSETLRIGIALADALQAAHEAGIVHRDVKPGNVLVTPEGRVRLTDFGIATAMLSVDELSDDGVLLGTAKYVAPEQVEGHLVDGRTDLYSLAIVLFECLTGEVPFDGPDERAVALARLRHVPIPVHELRPDVPAALDTLLATALRTRPSDRPATAAVFRDALARITVSRPSVAPSVAPADHTKRIPTAGTTPLRTDPTPPFGLAGASVGDDGEAAPLLATDPRYARWVVVVLVVAALVVSAVLIARARRTRPEGGASAAAGTVASQPTTAPAVTTGAPRQNAMAIVSVAEFDPPPGNGTENPGQLGRLTDGRPETAWSTVCYRQATMAPKQGLGLVFELAAPAKGHSIVVTTPTAGWAASVYVAREVGGRLRDWGPAVAEGRTLGPGDVELTLGDQNGRYVLVWFTNLGQPSCSALPFQLRVGEVAVVRA